jgi:hypothetical protein
VPLFLFLVRQDFFFRMFYDDSRTLERIDNAGRLRACVEQTAGFQGYLYTCSFDMILHKVPIP